jgi:hypothetical protein
MLNFQAALQALDSIIYNAPNTKMAALFRPSCEDKITN